MLGRYYRDTPYVGNLYTPPVNIVASVLEQAQNIYDQNLALAQGLQNTIIQARPQDRIRANELQNQYNSAVEQIVKKYDGDYSGATRELSELKYRMAKDFSPGGEAEAIQSKYAQQQASLARERERLAKGEITENQLRLLTNYYQSAPANALNPETGVYNQFPQIDLAKYVDRNKIFEDSLAKVKPKKTKIERPTGIAENGDYRYTTEERDWIDPEEVKSLLQSSLFENPEYVNYINQTAQLAGVDPQQVLQSIAQDYSENVLPARTGLVNYSQTNKFIDNWKGKEQLRYSNSLKLEAQKQRNRIALKAFDRAQEQAQEMSGLGSVLAEQKGINKSFSQIPKEISVGSSATIFGDLGAAFFPSLAGGGKSPVSVNKLIESFKRTGKAQFNANIPQLQSIKEANPNWSDSQIIDEYNRLNSNAFSAQEYGKVIYDKFETTASQKEEAERLLPRLASGRLNISYVEGNTGEVVRSLDAKSREYFYKGLSDRFKNKSPLARALGKSRAATGKVPVGTVFPDPYGGSGYYIVQEDRADIDRLQKEYLDPAFNFIQDDSRQQGDPFLIETQGTRGERKSIRVIGKKQYSNGKMSIVYYQTDEHGNYTNDDVLTVEDEFSGQKVPITPYELEKKLLPQQDVYSLYPRKTGAAFKNEVDYSENEE